MNNKEKSKLTIWDEDIASYSTFKSQIYSPNSVLYPSCGIDISPAKVFDNVTFVDISCESITALQNTGYVAINGDIDKYVPSQEHDLLILQNPAINPDIATKHLKSGKYVLANNYHSSATYLNEDSKNFTLWGVVNVINKNNKFIGTISRNLEDLFVEVKDVAELKEIRPKYYDYLQGEVKMLARNSALFDETKPFDELLKERCEINDERMPYRRVANRYIFLKK